MSLTSTIPSSASPGSDSGEGRSFLQKRKDNEAEKKLADWAREQYQKCKNARTDVERTWYMNMEMYLGNQWVTWGMQAAGGRLIPIKAAPYRAKPTINRIRPVIRTELSRVTSQKPNASVVPASSEDEDLFAAQAGEQVWESTYSRLKVNRTIRYMAWWLLLTGTGYIKTYWDENKVDRLSNVKGDFCIDFVTPFHVYVPDLTIIDIEDQPFVIQATTIPVEKARAMYPDRKFQPSTVARTEILDEAHLKIKTNNKPDSCLMLEVWIKPNGHPSFPQGGMFRTIDDQIVYKYTEGIPYSHGEYPYTKFEHIPTGKYYADSVIVDIKSLQQEYNRTRGQITDAKNRMAKPQLTAPEGSVDPKKITSEPGQMILYKPGFTPPSPLPLQNLPSYVIEELNRILADIEDLTAQHQVSKGNTPPGVTAATAINYLQEKDDSVLSHTYASMEEGLEKIARHVLTLAVQYWSVQRLVKVTGTDGAFDSLMLKGADLSKATDIRTEAGSALPVSKSARQAFIMDMMKMNFIPPDKGLELMEIGGVQKLYEELRTDERQAQRENLRMKTANPEEVAQYQQMQQMFKQISETAAAAVEEQSAAIPPELAEDLMPQPGQTEGNLSLAGQDPSQVLNFPGVETDPNTGQPLAPPAFTPVNTWDNHAVHIEVHNRFRKSQAFEVLPQPLKDLFEEHVQTHEQALMEKSMQALGGGMPGGMGVPPEMMQQQQPPMGM